jgi:hypothetical protein
MNLCDEYEAIRHNNNRGLNAEFLTRWLREGAIDYAVGQFGPRPWIADVLEEYVQKIRQSPFYLSRRE